MSTTKVITGKVRFSYVSIFKSRAFQAGQDAKYSVCLLIIIQRRWMCQTPQDSRIVQ